MNHIRPPDLQETPLPTSLPRVVVLSLASDFGCQVQLSNYPQLLDTLSTIDLCYWQLVSSAAMPDEYNIAIIEGAVTTSEHEALLRQVRDKAQIVFAVGACAVTGGVPAMAGDVERSAAVVYGKSAHKVAVGREVPRPVSSVIEVDYVLQGCPIDPQEFSNVLQGAILGVRNRVSREPLCAECKINETPCFYWTQYEEKAAVDRDVTKDSTAMPCLGLVTANGCGALCVSLGRPCAGCRGIAQDANLDAARGFLREFNRSVEEFDAALEIYNSHALREAAKKVAVPKQEGV